MATTLNEVDAGRQPVSEAQPPIFTLPNEILLSILNLLPTPSLLPLTPTCRHVHALIIRLVHDRLQIASGLAGYDFYLECHHPSARLVANRFFCTSLGTDGLDKLTEGNLGKSSYVEKIAILNRMHSRFKPRRHRVEDIAQRRHPAGDVPGSRTHPDSVQSDIVEDRDSVLETVTVDAHDLFTQLSTVSYLAKSGPRGLLFTLQNIAEGTIRVWRDWLATQCESRTWSDQDAVAIVRDGASGSSSKQTDADTEVSGSPKDPAVLWVNTGDNILGIKFRVRERKWRRTNTPLMYTSDVEIAASYEVEFEEVFVKTLHLLSMLEEAERQDNNSGKAIVFGHFAAT
ncbi:hypothetical protein MBLNU230_g5643t1 [Neophaeotheca triangularis]